MRDLDRGDAATADRPTRRPARDVGETGQGRTVPGAGQAVSPQTLAHLQRLAGNAAVAGLIPTAGRPAAPVTAAALVPRPPLAVQRDDGSVPAPSESPPAERVVTIETDRGRYENMPVPKALAFLADQMQWCANRIDLEAGDHAAMKQVHDQHWIVAGAADVFGGFLEMPDLAIWDAPRAAIARARAAVAGGDPAGAGEALRAANDSYQASRQQYLTYKEGHFDGADNTITVLKAVIVLDTAVAAAATGGATLGAAGTVLGGEATATVGASSILTQAAAAGVVGAEGAALKDTGEQVASGKAFNWAELAEQTAGGFASGFLAMLVTGPLKEMLTESCSGYVTEELMSDADLKELAGSLGVEELERNFLQSQLKTFIIEHLTDKAGEWLMGKPIDVVVEELKKAGDEGRPPPSENSAVNTVAEAAGPTIAAAFMSAHRAPAPAPAPAAAR